MINVFKFLQLDVGKRAATVVDTVVPEAGTDAVPEAEADAAVVTEESFFINVSLICFKFYNL